MKENEEVIEIRICEGLTIRKSIKKTIDERVRPRLWQWAYLGMMPLLSEIKNFSSLSRKEKAEKILDLGCGVKPYESMFHFIKQYIGFDSKKNDKVDVVGVNWDIPFKDSEFDGLISTQVLEHTVKLNETVKEIRRVVKDQGLIFISVPFVFPEHEIPEDFFRFTRYGLKNLFKDFKIIEIVPLGGYFGTLFFMLNNLLHYLPGSDHILFPIFTVNNLLGIIMDKISMLLFKLAQELSRSKILKDIYDKYYMGFPANYVIILRNIKKDDIKNEK